MSDPRLVSAEDLEKTRVWFKDDAESWESTEDDKANYEMVQELLSHIAAQAEEIERLRGEHEGLTAANHSVAVCARHTAEITKAEGLAEGCLICEIALLKRWLKEWNDSETL